MHVEILHSEASHYLILADELKAQYHDIDEETLRDTLEGISDLPRLIQEVVRSSLQDEVLQAALKARIDEMQERLERFKKRTEKKRELACWSMGRAGIDRLQAEDFSISLRHGIQRAEIIDPGQVPEAFLIPQPPRIDRTRLLARLKSGEPVPGTMLVQGEPHISVRVR